MSQLRGDVSQWYELYMKQFDVDPTGRLSLLEELNAPLAESELSWRLWVLSRDAVPADADNHSQIRMARQPVTVIRSKRLEVPVENDSETHTIVVQRQEVVAEALYAELRPHILAGEYEQAMPQLREVLDIDPDHADARYDLALAYIKTGDLDGAWEQYEHLKSLNMNLARMVRACLKPRAEQ